MAPDPRTASKTRIDIAGRTLREWWAAGLPEDEYGRELKVDQAVEVVWQFRAAFAQPLRKTIGGLRYMVEAEAGRLSPGQVTQRLKRLSAVVNKLYRHPSMRLTQMQDVGGCRAVLSGGAEEVERVRRRIERRWPVVAEDDYVASPDPTTGYRALHIVVERDDRMIEIQLRTPLQQRWAEQVERTQRILGEALKDGHGPEPVLRYYERLSLALAVAEAEQALDPDLIAEIEELERDLQARLTTR